MAATNIYDVGDQIRCQGTFTDADGTAIDPGTVTFKIRDPSGNIDTYVYGDDAEVVKSSTGVYYVDITTDEHGRWFYRFAGTVTGISAGEEHFNVRDSMFD